MAGSSARPLRTTGSRNARGCIEGWVDMVWRTVEAVGFLALTVVVIALARRSTSRWEQEKRARRATRRDDVARPGPPRRAAAPLRGGEGRWGARGPLRGAARPPSAGHSVQ